MPVRLVPGGRWTKNIMFWGFGVNKQDGRVRRVPGQAGAGQAGAVEAEDTMTQA